jgi:hypothetical protein
MSAISAPRISSGGPAFVAGRTPRRVCPRASSSARPTPSASPRDPHHCQDAATSTTTTSSSSQHATAAATRRGVLSSIGAASLVAAAAAAPSSSPLVAPRAAWAKTADMKSVGSYLPASPASAGVPEGFVLYTVDSRSTPATRAGVLKPPLYSFSLHPSLRQQPLVNSRTGDFCFPGCAEPWYELEAKSPEIGKVFLCALFLKKLRPGSRGDGGGLTVEDLGAPDVFARAVGPLVTGEGYEEEDLVGSSVRKESDGEIFYDLELLASTADPSGPHRFVSATVHKDVVYLFVGAATNAQWTKTGGEAAIKAMARSFRAC